MISAGVRPHQQIQPRLPAVHFSASAVLIRAAGEGSIFHSRKLRNVSARKVKKLQRDQLFCRTSTRSAAERPCDGRDDKPLMGMFLTHDLIFLSVFCLTTQLGEDL